MRLRSGLKTMKKINTVWGLRHKETGKLICSASRRYIWQHKSGATTALHCMHIETIKACEYVEFELKQIQTLDTKKVERAQFLRAI